MSAKPQRVKSIEVNTASLTIFYLEQPNSFYKFDKSGYWVVFKDGDLYEK